MSAKSNPARVFVWIIIIIFFLTSFATTAFVVLDLIKNKDKPNSSQQTSDIQKQLQDQANKKKETQMPKEPLTGYSAEPFDKSSVAGLKVEELKPGDGQAATADSTVKANYFGWTSDGKIFDSSQRGETATPVEFPLNGVIKGWTNGLTGVKAGAVVKLIIPADQAYGASGSPPNIGPNEPLEFIVQLVEVK